MDTWFNPRKELDRCLRATAVKMPEFDQNFSPGIQPAEPRFGDFQANGVLPHAKRHGLNPRETAQNLVAELEKTKVLNPDRISVSVAGPGFINFTLGPRFLLDWLQSFRTRDDFKAAAGDIYHHRKVVIDYSAPNTAKQMHVGHIRSIAIGEAIQRLLRFCGADVIRDNHIGDWGTQFGILIMAIKESGYDLDAANEDPLADFERLYREGNARFVADDEAKKAARGELVKLQQGDNENISLWQRINQLSYIAFEEIYDLLDIHFDKVLGESFYRDSVARVYDELSEDGIAEDSQGALVVFHREHKRFKEQPFIIRKSDGASNYPSTDLATILYRVENLMAEEIIYVVDARQNDHFQQLFLTTEKWFQARKRPLPKLLHVSFGTILGENGKAIKTRTGEPVKLKDLLHEAIERAFTIVTEKNPNLSEAERRNIARVVGLGAIRYADLSQNRTSDYIFSWPKLLSFEGNTAPYLLYAVARIHSIYRKAGFSPGAQEENPSQFETDTEIALARKLVGFVVVLEQTLGDLRPHYLCSYLYELAGAFSTFYNADRVIVDESPVRARRLILCARTLCVLETGLHLLGLKTLERM